MNRDTDLFVQAFWVKCRETIRPELDFTVDDIDRDQPSRNGTVEKAFGPGGSATLTFNGTSTSDPATGLPPRRAWAWNTMPGCSP